MTFLDRLTGLFRKGGDTGAKNTGAKNTGAKNTGAKSESRSELQKNMEKALHMKQEAGPRTSTPEHRTAREGMKAPDDPHMSDATRGAEAGFTPQLKRSKVARSGDT
jgi:hypothetical protein